MVVKQGKGNGEARFANYLILYGFSADAPTDRYWVSTTEMARYNGKNDIHGINILQQGRARFDSNFYSVNNIDSVNSTNIFIAMVRQLYPSTYFQHKSSTT